MTIEDPKESTKILELIYELHIYKKVVLYISNKQFEIKLTKQFDTNSIKNPI